ncbi:MAG: glycosyltransferase [Arthrobacter sp.]|nr:glycosyltransferase [Micrococcaceae bacterium]MDN5812119.1 glycosyltransferase [Micrococcaceae bacterium]MDN5823023.1 glycosyltransferase [Micrococcaceae bacterium]MDN5880694.1 glycosyltransferase [Micrococcaceae bacterium]MDN5888062.1 glycosyltransferase [Micrococcaceae bacterium]
MTHAPHPATHLPDPENSPPLHVAMLCLHTSPLDQPGSGDAGGMNVYVREVALAMASSGLLVDIFTRGPRGTESVSLNERVRVHHVPAGPDGPLAKEDLPDHLPEITARIAGGDHGPFDIIHSHYWMSGIVGLELASRWELPLVHTMHTLAKVKRRLQQDAEESDRRVEAETQLARRATRLTANSQAEADELVTDYGAEPSRIDLVVPGVNLQTFHPEGPRMWVADAGHTPGPAVDPLRLVFAGRIQKLKGPQVLLRALGLLARTRPDIEVELAIIGSRSGSKDLDLARLIDEEQLQEIAHLLPPSPADELAAWFRAADVVAVPSYSESFGLVAMEAQACGTPVLAHDVGGLRHSVADGSTGVLVPDLSAESWAEAIAHAATHRDDVARMGHTAVARSHGFSWMHTATATRASYARATIDSAEVAP